MNFHSSWSHEAQDYFENAIVAHGGWSAWERLDQIEVDLVEFSGFLLSLKGLGRTFEKPLGFLVDPKSRRVEFRYASHTDVFDDGALTFSPSRSSVADGRSLFSRGIFEKWRPEHALYFFGYALANYAGYPFILPQFELLKWSKSERWFQIRFPREFHTHSRVQTFYFDKNYMLSRHDYRADSAGWIFYGAHFTRDYTIMKGIAFAREREVKPGYSRFVLPARALFARLR